LRILVADDNHLLAGILADHLAARGHSTVPTYEGRLASILCQQRDFDAIVIDLVLPDVNGIDVLEQLHQQHRMPRAIVMTGFPELLDELAARLAAVGVEAVINKPFSFSELDDVLAQLH
jgi:CheY-like chemotaxis protein